MGQIQRHAMAVSGTRGSDRGAHPLPRKERGGQKRADDQRTPDLDGIPTCPFCARRGSCTCGSYCWVTTASGRRTGRSKPPAVQRPRPRQAAWRSTDPPARCTTPRLCRGQPQVSSVGAISAALPRHTFNQWIARTCRKEKKGKIQKIKGSQ